MTEQTCPKCGESKPLADFYPDVTKRLGVHGTCKECVKAYRRRSYAADPQKFKDRDKRWRSQKADWQREYYRARRRRVLAEYGGACACCGETTPEFLAIDHVNNDGESHRRELKGYGRSIYDWLHRNGYPKDGRFQLLCHNCNMAKGLYGGCPHQGDVPGRRIATQEFVA